MRIAVLGGTGPEGLGIAARLAAAGEEIVIGSRDLARATGAAATLASEVAGARVQGKSNCDAATASDTVVLAIPAAGVDELLDGCGDALRGKVVLEVVNPLVVERGVFRVAEAWSAGVAARIAARVPDARVVSGLKHESAANLRALDRRLEGDVLLCANDGDAKAIVAGLVRHMPDLRPIDAGGLAVAPLLDQVTALLLNLNRRHKVESSLRIVGL
jgi:8-hydroxy-5-deazaflavin:NADPH oxidoreductase